jgi:hypothetical protein
MSVVQVVPNLSTTQGCDAILWADFTPYYNSITSPFGYDTTGVNSTNPSDVDTNHAYLDITPISTGVLYTLQIPSANFDATQIAKAGFSTFSIPASTFGASTIPDGIYKLTYRFQLISSGKIYQVTKYFKIICAIQCCIDKQLNKLGCCTDCKDEKNNRVIYNLYRVHMLKDKIDYQLACNDITGAQSTVNCLTDFCNLTVCDSCTNK